MTPCSPATLGNFLIPDCRISHARLESFDVISLSILLACITISFWLFLDMIGGFVFHVMELFFMPCYALKYYLKYFQLLIFTEHFTDQGRINEHWRSLQQRLQIYSELQILSKLYNTIQKDVIIITLMWIVIFAVVVCLYSLLTLGSDVSLFQLLVFAMVLVDSFMVIIVMFGTFGKFNQKSCTVLSAIRTKYVPKVGNKSVRNWLRKCMTSMPPMKVKLGQVNFVDNFTPLVMINFCFSQLVNLLLI